MSSPYKPANIFQKLAESMRHDGPGPFRRPRPPSKPKFDDPTAIPEHCCVCYVVKPGLYDTANAAWMYTPRGWMCRKHYISR